MTKLWRMSSNDFALTRVAPHGGRLQETSVAALSKIGPNIYPNRRAEIQFAADFHEKNISLHYWSVHRPCGGSVFFLGIFSCARFYFPQGARQGDSEEGA